MKQVSFSLEEGEILGLVGENGAGKSTLMKILFGMNVISETGGYEGDIRLDGEKVIFENPFSALDAGIGMVHQEFSLIPGFTAAENILLNREILNYNILAEIFGDGMQTLDRGAMHERANRAISRLDVQLEEESPVSEMPVGHKQFIEIARELDRESVRILILDEPTAALSEAEAEVMLQSIRKLSRQGIAVIFISHRLGEVLEITDKIVVLRDGEAVKEAATSEVVADQIAEWMVGREIEERGTVQKKSGISRRPILEIENLWVDMPGEVVRDVSFTIEPAEIFGISGLAGQGKIGIPNGIMGLYSAGGRVKIDGRDVPLNSPASALKAGMAFVSEDRRGVGLLLDEPLDWNIVFTAMQTQQKYLKPFLGGLIKLRDEKAIMNETGRYIDALDIKCVSGKQKVKELSGGNQQKVCLAKAFAQEPRILFVSEPTRGIDVGAKDIILETLLRYNKENKTTIVMVSSELEELRAVCDRIAVVSEGRIAAVLPAHSKSSEFGLLMVGKKRADGKS